MSKTSYTLFSRKALNMTYGLFANVNAEMSSNEHFSKVLRQIQTTAKKDCNCFGGQFSVMFIDYPEK